MNQFTTSHAFSTDSLFFPEFSVRHQCAELGHDIRGLLCFDEVGRGCVAGPVTAAVTFWQLQGKSECPLDVSSNLLKEVRDSKKLSEKKREKIADAFCALFPETQLQLQDVPSSLTWPSLTKPKTRVLVWNEKVVSPQISDGQWCLSASALGWASPAEVDEFNIWCAVQTAMARATEKILYEVLRSFLPHQLAVIVDGNREISVQPQLSNVLQVTAVKGDDKLRSVGLSSVLAKVARDRHMKGMAEIFPGYFFDENKGYGTPRHMQACQKLPLTPQHRRTFLRNIFPSPLLNQ